MWFIQMNTACCSFTEVSGYHAGVQGRLFLLTSRQACSLHKRQSLFLAVEFQRLELQSNDSELYLGIEIPYVSSKNFGMLVVSLLNNPLPWDRPAICQIFLLLCDFSQDSESLKLSKTEQTEKQLVVIFLFFSPADYILKKSQLILRWLSFL